MITGKANQQVNIRATPAVTATNDIGDILMGQTFKGSGIEVGANAIKYIKLTEVAGKPVTGYVSTAANISWQEVPDAPAVKFPSSYTVTNNDDGSKALYEFVRVL